MKIFDGKPSGSILSAVVFNLPGGMDEHPDLYRIEVNGGCSLLLWVNQIPKRISVSSYGLTELNRYTFDVVIIIMTILII